MVFFCCDGCGETLKKNQVDAHAGRCRECYAVSCVDCSVSFPGDDYRAHTTCISEAERYEKTVYRGVRKLDNNNGNTKQQHKRKLTPQEAWTETIATAAETAPPSLKSYMNQLVILENVPRKEKQFRNFATNSFRLKNGNEGKKIQDEIWNLLVKVREDQKRLKEEEENKLKESKSAKEQTNTKPAEKAPVSVSDDEPSKRNSDATRASACNSKSTPPSEKEVLKAVKKILKKAPDQKIKFKELRKQVKKNSLVKTEKKKLKSMLKQCLEANPKKFKIDDKVVSLIK